MSSESTPNDVIRTLAAILMADVANYGKLMGEDEPQTVRTLQACREIFRKQIESHRGTVLDAKGDAIMARFNSAVDAVAASVAIQQEIEEKNNTLAEYRQMRFRIGVNLGDVVEEDETLYGDGVNIAGRLESMAPPGGVCVSRMVHDNVIGKLPFEFRNLGKQQVKTETVQAYAVTFDSSSPVARQNDQRIGGDASRLSALSKRSVAVGISISLAVAASAWWVWRSDPAQNQPQTGLLDSQSLEALQRGIKIAVLPLKDFGPVAGKEHFADGLTQEIHSEISGYSDIYVIARRSADRYRDQVVDVRLIGEELGADYILEGSIRISGERVKVSTLLSETNEGTEVWSESYNLDFNGSNLVEMQESVATKIASIVSSRDGVVARSQRNSSKRGSASSLAGYDCVLRRLTLVRNPSPDFHRRIRDCLELTVSQDPGYSAAWSALGYTYLDEVVDKLNPMPDSLERAEDAFQTAIRTDPGNAWAYSGMAAMYHLKREPDAFLNAADKALSLSSDPAILAEVAIRLPALREWERALQLLDMAMALNPNFPSWYHAVYGQRHYEIGEYAESVARYNQVSLRRWFWLHSHLAASYAMLGRTDEALQARERLLELYPDFAVNVRDEISKWIWDEAVIEHYLDGLRKAGLEISEKS